MIQTVQHEVPLPGARTGGEPIADPKLRLRATVSLFVQVETALDWRGGRGTRHRALALTGSIRLPELRAELVFRSRNGNSNGNSNGNGNGNGNGHADEQWANLTIVPRQFTMTVPLQHLAPPAREGSDVWALTPAPDRDPPWREHYFGRLEAGTLRFDQNVPVEVTLDLAFTPMGSEDGHGSNVAVGGELRFEGPTQMRFLFRDPADASAPPSGTDDEGAMLIAANTCVPIARQSVTRLAGHHPSIGIRVTDAEGRVVCAEQPLGEPGSAA